MGVSIRQQKRDGIWYVHVRHRGQRAAQRCVDAQHALDTAEDVRKAIRRGEFDIAAMKTARAPAAKEEKLPTVEEYYDKTFLPVYVESALAASTAASYRKNFKTHILPALGGWRLNDVNDHRMEEFVAELVKKSVQVKKRKAGEEAGANTESSKKPTLAKATIDTVIKQLRKFFNHARKRKIIVENPATGLSQLYSQARTAHEVIEALTREEVPLFLAKVKEHDNAFVTVTRPDGTKAKRKVTQHYPLFFMAIHTGLRAGELAGLQRGDIDFHGKYVIVQRSIDRAHGKVVPTKTKKIRRVDLSDELIAVLKEHLRQQKEWWFAEGKPQPEWLFPNTEGEWPDMRNIADRHFDRCLEKAGLHHRRFHDLRHSFASLLLTNGAPMAYVSEQMGHASIQLTVKLYGHLQPGANRHWMNSLPTLNSPTETKAVAAD